MQKLIIILVFILCKLSYAQLPSYNFSIESILKNVNTKEEENKCQEVDSKKNPYQECIVSICGDPKEYTTLLDSYISVIESTDVSADKSRKEIEAVINGFYDLEKEQYSFDQEGQMKDIVDRVLKNIDVVKAGKQLNIIPFIQVSEMTSDIVQYNEEKEEYEILEDKMEKYSDLINDKDRIKKITRDYHNVILNLISQLQYSAINPLATLAGISKKNDLSEQDKIIDVINQMKEKMSEINKVLPEEVSTNLYQEKDLDVLIEKAKNKTILEVDIKSLITKYQYMEIYLIYTREIENNLEYYNKMVKDGAKAFLAENNIDEVAQKIIELGKKRDIKDKEVTRKDRNEALSKCLNSFDRNIQLVPTQNQLNAFKQEVDKYKINFKQNITQLNGISKDTRSNLGSKLDSLEFGLPFSREDWKKSLESSLKLALDKKKNAVKLSNEVSIKELQVLYLLHKVKNPEEENEDDEEETSELGDICDELEQESFGDKTYTGFGKILLSYTMVNAEDYYKEGVIFHEIAHNLEKFLRDTEVSSKKSTDSFNNLTTCLGDVQRSIGVTECEHYFSEDFADFIAMKMSFNKDKSDMCEYLRTDKTSHTYTADTVLNEDKDDTHSSTLFRVIRNTIDKLGNAPKSCIDALNSEGIVVVPSSCEY